MSHDDQDQVFKYYVLQTISGKEEAVKDYINGMRDVEPFFDKNVREILVPMETTITKRRTASGKRVNLSWGVPPQDVVRSAGRKASRFSRVTAV